MIKSSNETMWSHGIKTDKLCVNAGIEENSSCGETVMSEAESFQERYDDYLSEEDQIELLQQNEFINSLFYERNCFNEVMFNDEKFVIDNDKLIYLNGKMKSDGKIIKPIAEMEDQNSIMMKGEEIVTARNLTCDKEEDSEGCINVFSNEMTDLWHELSVRE